MNTEKIAERCNQIVSKYNVILLVEAGSKMLGLADEDSDKDLMGIFIEDQKGLVGFSPTDTVVWRSAEERTGKSDAKSEAGDIDLTLYGLRKYLKLVLAGNPTLVNLLLAPDPSIVKRTEAGSQLQNLRKNILSRQLSKAFLGYLTAQRLRLMGSAGQKRTNRTELEGKYGFDTKYAMHMLRLGIQGKLLMENGDLRLPLDSDWIGFLQTVKKGLVSYDKCIAYAQQYENTINKYMEVSPLPVRPDYLTVENWMLDVYKNAWNKDTATP